MLVHDRTGLVDAFTSKNGLVIDPEGQAQFRFCQLLPGSRQMLGMGYMYRLSLWNLDTGRRVKLCGRLAKQQGLDSTRLFADGTTLLTWRKVMPDAKKLQLWNFHTGELLSSLLPAVGEIIFSDVSPDSRTVAATQDMGTVLSDVASRRPQVSSVDERIRGHVRFHPGGELLAAPSETGVVLLDAHPQDCAGTRLRN